MRKFIFVLCFLALSFNFVFASSPSAVLSDSDFGSFSDLRLMSISRSNERVTASDSNGFKSVILNLIGDYETVITDYTYQSSSGYTTHSISVERDWSWIMSCVLFIVIIFCTFLSCAKILSRL